MQPLTQLSMTKTFFFTLLVISGTDCSPRGTMPDSYTRSDNDPKAISMEDRKLILNTRDWRIRWARSNGSEVTEGITINGDDTFSRSLLVPRTYGRDPVVYTTSSGHLSGEDSRRFRKFISGPSISNLPPTKQSRTADLPNIRVTVFTPNGEHVIYYDEPTPQVLEHLGKLILEITQPSISK